jgi:hypothetical protein
MITGKENRNDEYQVINKKAVGKRRNANVFHEINILE